MMRPRTPTDNPVLQHQRRALVQGFASAGVGAYQAQQEGYGQVYRTVLRKPGGWARPIQICELDVR